MNILLIAPSFPYPLTHGGKIRVFNIIKYLSKIHHISFACLSDQKVTGYGSLAGYCEEINVVEQKSRAMRDVMLFLLRGEPYNALRYTSHSFQETLSGLLKKKKFDIVQVEFPMLWQYAAILNDLPVVLDMHNIEFRLIGQMKESAGNILKRVLYGMEEQRLRRIEEDAWRECDLCVAVSDKERDVIRSYLGKDDKLITVPNGVDLERFEYHRESKGEKRILFIGSMDYIPTIDSTDYLLQEILPIIISKINDVKLDIVGRELWRISDKAAMKGVTLHEDAPDILPFLREAEILIDPLRIGAGTRLKILEAMASGTPVVTTSKGCEGIMVKNGEHLLIADTPVDFADSVVKLLTDRKLAENLAASSRHLIEEHYSWEKIVHRLEVAMGSLL